MNKYDEMIEYKENFASKISKMLKKLFGRNKVKYSGSQEIPHEKNQKLEQGTFMDEIQVDTTQIDKTIIKEDFLEKINGNTEVLKLLSIDRLKKLNHYYDEIIKENEIKINKLKRK